MQIISRMPNRIDNFVPSTRFNFEFTAHESMILAEAVEELVPHIFQYCVKSMDWNHYVNKLNRRYSDFSETPIMQNFLELLSPFNVQGKRIWNLNPAHINALYQLLNGKPPINEYPEISLKATLDLKLACWTIQDPLVDPLYLSRLRQEGVDLFDQTALLKRIIPYEK